MTGISLHSTRLGSLCLQSECDNTLSPVKFPSIINQTHLLAFPVLNLDVQTALTKQAPSGGGVRERREGERRQIEVKGGW